MDPLRQTKFFVPEVRPEAIQRTRLARSMGDPPTVPLTLVIAPPGFGKTTLLAAAQARFSCNSAWLSLDELDNDAVRFLRHLVGALQHAGTGVGARAERLLSGPQPVPPQGVLTELLNEISEATAPLVLVIDDYHVIHNRVVHEALGSIFEHITPQLRVILSSRHSPPFPLAKLRVRDHLREFSAEDLRFRRDEIANYVQTHHPEFTIDEELLDLMEEKTEGWIGALRLLCRSVSDHPSPAQRIKNFSGDHRYIADYLAEEVIAQLPDAARAFLQRSSIVERMTGPLCDAITEVSEGAERLKQLELDGLFLVPIDPERTWYRYHNLFRDVLRHQLSVSANEDLSQLHRRASGWFAENGFLAEALSHAIAGEDWEGTRRLMQPIENEMLRDGRFHDVLHWLEAIPEDIRNAHSEMALSYAWAALMSGSLAKVATPLEHAEKIFEAAGDTAHLAETAVVRAHFERFRGSSRVALERIEKALDVISDDTPVRSHALLGTGVLRSSVDGPQASLQPLHECIEHAEAIGAPLMFFAATNVLANQEIQLGHLNRATERLRAALQRAGDRPHSQVIETHTAFALLLRERHRLEEAETHYRTAIAIATQRQVQAFWPHAHIGLARIYRTQGKIDLAREEMDTALRLIDESGYTKAVATVGAWSARLSLELGDLGAARAWLRQNSPIDATASSAATVSLQVRVMLTEQRHCDALELLQRRVVASEAEDRRFELIEILLLLAQTHGALRDDSNSERLAIDAIYKATAIAAPEDAVWSFLEELPAIAPLLGALRSRKLSEMERAFVEKIVRLGAATDSLPNVLSRREREVLELIDEGGSNDEIARSLFISTNTVKTHIRKIFEKLEVHNRTQALSRARELGLL